MHIPHSLFDENTFAVSGGPISTQHFFIKWFLKLKTKNEKSMYKMKIGSIEIFSLLVN